MEAKNKHSSLADLYFGVLEHLDQDSKLDLIAKLSLSLKHDINQPVDKLLPLFGAYQSEETADEIVSGIRASRVFTRNIETL